MEKGYVIFGGVAILVGIIILYSTAIFTANSELVHGIEAVALKDYRFTYYAIACFILGVISILIGFINSLKLGKK
ncbi:MULTISPECIES: hypothetical protein [Rummeliibacillus]|uniref:hypothetical protein n=1 Tax=Rummeliibacillus TaxID=648802 RepID=UPI0011B4AC29|nr:MULTISPECIES: hypothetical protein [Rummeliibacillus]